MGGAQPAWPAGPVSQLTADQAHPKLATRQPVKPWPAELSQLSRVEARPVKVIYIYICLYTYIYIYT